MSNCDKCGHLDPSPSHKLEEMEQKVDEIHQFIQVLSNALNSPMIRGMLPPGMLGK